MFYKFSNISFFSKNYLYIIRLYLVHGKFYGKTQGRTKGEKAEGKKIKNRFKLNKLFL